MTDGNGNAFPEIETEITHDCGVQFNRTFSHNGLTKREYFAAMAMQGMCAVSPRYREPDADAQKISEIAERSVQVADALIQALNK